MTAAYLASCDPITFGHINIIHRASRMFAHVILGIGDNPSKHYVFDQAQRVQIARDALSGIRNVSVIGFQGLGVDFAFEHGAQVIIRGVRNSKDFEYESDLRFVYDSQARSIETLLMFADPSLASVSSSSVRAIEAAGGDITPYVPLAVKKALERKMSNRVIIGVTGDTAAGKSFFCDQAVLRGCQNGFRASNLDADLVAREILFDREEPVYQQFRADLAHELGIPITDREQDRRRLSDLLFSNPEKMRVYNQKMRPLLLTRIRKEIAELQGVVLLNSALLVEASLLPFCNNHVIHIYNLDPDLQRSRMRERGLTDEQIGARISALMSRKERDSRINQAIAESHFGHMYCVYDDLTRDATLSMIEAEGGTLRNEVEHEVE